MIRIRTIALSYAAVRNTGTLRFFVDVFYGMFLPCGGRRTAMEPENRPGLKRIRALALVFPLLLFPCVLCGCSPKGGEPVLEPIDPVRSVEAAPAKGDAQADAGNMIKADAEADNETAAGAQDGDRQRDLLMVHVCGAVRKEGVYTLPAGSRICDAIEAAGGFGEGADTSYLNLAMEIEDAWQIRVPSKGETEAASSVGSMADSAGAGRQKDRINLNTAGKEELMKIPGVGEAKAQRIIDYREQNGYFRVIEDLMKVPGIKDASFQKMKEFITV